jgi:hypothetical protein
VTPELEVVVERDTGNETEWEETGTEPGKSTFKRQRPGEASPNVTAENPPDFPPLAAVLDQVLGKHKAPALAFAAIAKGIRTIATSVAGEASLAPGQAEAVACLTAEERAGLAHATAEERAKFLEPHKLGFDRVIFGEQRRRFRPPAPPPEVIPPDASVEELLETLGWGRDVTLPQRATRALMADIGDRGRSWSYIHGLVMEVWRRRRPVACLLEPYRRTMAQVTAGKDFEKGRAAYFVRCVQNYIREDDVSKVIT